jgi:hypothetical protein
VTLLQLRLDGPYSDRLLVKITLPIFNAGSNRANLVTLFKVLGGGNASNVEING